jgi:hypothetical protein
MMILARDGKTGKILVSPPEDELWLLRRKAGYGRAARNEWETVRYVGPDFFEEMDEAREFRLGFEDYYDVYIWSTDAGAHSEFLHASILEVSVEVSNDDRGQTNSTRRCFTNHIVPVRDLT